MSQSFDPPALSYRDDSRQRRLLPLLLTILAHVLLLLLVIRLAPPFARMRPRQGGQLVAVDIAPAAEEQAAPAKGRRQAQRSSPAAATAPVPPPPIKLPTTAAPWVLTPGLEHFDMRQLPSTSQSEQPSDASAADNAGDSGRSDRPVAYGPSGQPLYDAQWYREPTDAELRTYTSRARAEPGFGEIGCQTVARFHVDNCVMLAETAGSGYARAVKDAAWQFLVIPPRVGGRPMVGAWVRIRITFSERGSD